MRGFTSKKRKAVNESNQMEYLRKKQHVEGEDPSGTHPPTSTRFNEASPSARTEAIKIDRKSQIKHDTILHQESPHLENTIDKSAKKEIEGPLLDERVENIEEHFNVEYTPRPPSSLLTRIKLLEQHIMMLEREHPAWSALHFAQPRRRLGGIEKIPIKVKPQDAIT